MSGHRGTPWDQYTLTEGGLFLTDNTIADVSTARHGLAPKLPNDSAKYLDGTGAYTVPGGGSNTGSAVFAPAGPKTPIVMADFTARKIGSSSYVTSARDGTVSLTVPSENSGVGRGYDKAVPATPYYVICNLMFGNPIGGNQAMGLYWFNVSDDKGIGWFRLGNSFIYAQLSAANHDYSAVGATYVNASNWGSGHAPTLWALGDDGTNRTYYLGEQEDKMYLVFSHARTTGITPDRIGFFSTTRLYGGDCLLHVSSWKEQATAPV